MRLHSKFSRFKGTVPVGAKALGAAPENSLTTSPTDSGTVGDNSLVCPVSTTAGIPSQRIAIAYKGPVGAINLPAALWFWDSLTESWYLVDAVTLVPNKIVFANAVPIGDKTQLGAVSSSGGGGGGGIFAKLIVPDPGGAPAGEHVFAMGPTLSVP